ncbi:MAG: hypothetical protein K1X55_11465 [Chitinophagales bacterium]|nr:hypothetical protein [Chitinophagales bacterium]
MKKWLLMLFMFGMFGMQAQAKKGGGSESTIVIKYSFKGIEDGYDHNSKAVISIDGEEVYTSRVHKESSPQTITLKVPMGKFDFNLMMWAEYEGNWEEHSIDNNYSFDCAVDETFKASKKKHTLTIIFDLDEGVDFTYK